MLSLRAINTVVVEPQIELNDRSEGVHLDVVINEGVTINLGWFDSAGIFQLNYLVENQRILLSSYIAFTDDGFMKTEA